MRRLFGILRALLKALCFAYFRLDVQGLAHLPRRGGAVVAGNHPSLLDGLLLWVVSPRPVRFLIAEDMYRHPLLRPGFEALGCIEVSRTKARNGEALRAAAAALERGELIGIFPEGTIRDQGRMRQLKKGVALLALRSGAPVVPFAIRGSREAFPDGARVPRPGGIRLRFAAPVSYPPTALDPIPEDQVAAALEDVRHHILRTMARMGPLPSPHRARRGLTELRAAAAALVIWPLAGLLTRTARPSLDPARTR
jgi:1-acyl-sn-glycerol-3-phosphate acyltransferase